MRFCYFLFFASSGGRQITISDADKAAISDIVLATPGLTKALIYTPEVAQDLFNDDGASPPFGLQLYFDELTGLEAAVAPDGHLQALATPGLLTSLEGATVTQQAMYARSFAVDDAELQTPAGALPCSYVVYYPGPAEDTNAWLSHYIASHPPVMRKFPGIRAIEILSRIDWCGGLPFARVDYLQRNRVMFDSAGALTTALQSPVRHEMRADFASLPAYEGGNFHYPMATQTIVP